MLVIFHAGVDEPNQHKVAESSRKETDDYDEGDLVPNDEDAALIDNEGVAPDERVDFMDDIGEGGLAYDEAEEAKEDMEDEMDKLFGRDRRRESGQGLETRAKAESLLAQMEAAFEADREAFAKGEPALNKLRMLKKVEENLSIDNMHEDLMSGGVLGALRGWLEIMPDGSLPNSKIRTSILIMLDKLRVDCSNEDHREQLKRSGIGRIVMFLSKLPDETQENRRLAQKLVQTWSRPILGANKLPESREVNQETREAGRIQAKAMREADPYEMTKASANTDRKHAMIPQAAELDYVARPKSKVTVPAVRQSRPDKEPKLLKKLRVMGGKVAKKL